jgi:UDP-N-acetylglucosamine:LPS N-acetylglucosamine transferase
MFGDTEDRVQAQSGGILILTSSTGAGHDSVAIALREALHALAPEVRVRILDPLSGRRSNGPLSPGRWYDATVAHAPWLWGLFYHATNNAWTVRIGKAASSLLWAHRLRSAIRAERPAIIVSAHPLCTHLAASVLDTMPAAPLLHCVVTDLVTIHRCWASGRVDTFSVPTPDACDALIAMGIPGNRIHITGLPLRASFARAPQELAGGTSPRVLLLGGGCPVRRVEKVVRALTASHLPLRLIVVCGRNARLRLRLTRVVGAQATVLGWCDDIATLMRWSSVVIAKAGPTTLAEALSQARPLIIHQMLPGQESGNITLIQRIGAGRYIPDIEALVCGVAGHAHQTACTAQAVWWGGAARRVAAFILTGRVDVAMSPHPHGLSGYRMDHATSACTRPTSRYPVKSKKDGRYGESV